MSYAGFTTNKYDFIATIFHDGVEAGHIQVEGDNLQEAVDEVIEFMNSAFYTETPQDAFQVEDENKTDLGITVSIGGVATSLDQYDNEEDTYIQVEVSAIMW